MIFQVFSKRERYIFVIAMIFIGYGLFSTSTEQKKNKEIQDNASQHSDIYCGMSLERLKYFLGEVTRIEPSHPSNSSPTMFWEYEDTQQKLKAKVEYGGKTQGVTDIKIADLNSESWSRVLECGFLGGEFKTLYIDTTKIRYK